jgi:hypothetical protein
MDRIRVAWSGPGVAGPGLTTFYTISGEMDPGAVLTFFDAIKAQLPDDVQLTIPSSGDSMSEIGGAITSSWAAAGGGVVSGTSSGTFALGQGLRIVWDTNGIRNGRHVRGSTFIAPVVSTAFDTTGRVAPAVQATFTTAANNLRTALGGALVVWSRPKGVQGGIMSPVTSVQVPETPTALRSRRR